MEKFLESYWQMRLEALKEELEKEVLDSEKWREIVLLGMEHQWL